MESFVHLRSRSVYTLSQGASKIPDLVARAKDLGMPSLALTDKGNLYGAMDFSKAAGGAGVQPIVGCELTVDIPSVGRGGVLFLARDAQGYARICGMLRHAAEHADRKTDEPILPGDLLTSEGVIALCGTAPNSLFANAMTRGGPQACAAAYRTLLARYGDSFYAEICRTEIASRNAPLEQTLLQLADGRGGEVACLDGVTRSETPLVATSDVWYAKPERHDAWLLLREVSRGGSVVVKDEGIEDASTQRYHMRSPEEMKELFADLPEAYRNATEIAKRSAFMVKGRNPILPAFPTGEGRTEAQELRRMAEDGLRARLTRIQTTEQEAEVYWKRLEFELVVIENMGFPGYFLIVADFIQWAKGQDIPVGPGRGSGAGSIVAWALTITDINPLPYGLLFERFLNPERVSMPDFDIDFCQDRRDEVIAYVRERYGADRVAAIATFGEIKSKTALTDMQRVVISAEHGKVTFNEAKDLTKMIPGKPDAPADPMGLEQAYQEATAFREAIDGSVKLKLIYDQARKVEGLMRSAGLHAAGIVIGDRPIDELTPVGFDLASGMPVVGFNLKGAEAAGLVKFDFLGLKTLSVMAEAVRHIKATTGEDVDLSAIPLDDPQVMERFSEGHTTGVFQFESVGMRNVMRQVRPTKLSDLIAINALYRPGPMAYIPLYSQRKNGEVEVEYPSPTEKTKPFLEETYGIMVYQEQVMQVAQACAGYSLGGADLLRRAMGKKIPAEMDKHRKIFVHGDPGATPPVPGAVALGMQEKVAEKLFDDIAAFAGYGFNKSHSAAYAWIGYQTAWLKTYYPAAFFAALMTYNADDAIKLSGIKDEMAALKVPLLPPNINMSRGRFGVEATKAGNLGVRFGLMGIKRVSGNLDELSAIREEGGQFVSLEDFHARSGKVFNKGQIEKLSEAGAFEDISTSCRQAFSVLSWLIDRKDKAPSGQTDMFGGVTAVPVPASVMDVPEWADITQREYSALGFYAREHPIDRYRDRLESAGIRRRRSFAAYMNEKGDATLRRRRICVIVDDVKIRQTKTSGVTYIEGSVSEKEDSYRVACYAPRGRMTGQSEWNINRFKDELEAAKQTKMPVVLVCSLTLGDGDTVWVNVDEVHKVEDYLINVHGPLSLRIDENRINLDYKAALAIDALRKAGREGEAVAAEKSARAMAIKTNAARILTRLKDISDQVDDGDWQQFRIVDADNNLLSKGELRQSNEVLAEAKQMGLVAMEEHSPAIADSPQRQMAA